jgi:hypothetical protein
MRKLLTIAVLVMACAVSAMAQKGLEADLMKSEKAAWDAFGRGDGKFFQSFLADDSVMFGDSGIQTKAEGIKMISSKPCEVKSYNFSNFKVSMVNPTTALVTYSATEDATCGGQPAPAKVNVSTIYVKRNGKWLGYFHQESPVM